MNVIWLLLLIYQQPQELLRYEDSKGRFSFEYPKNFGTTEAGTNDGFGERVAAIRFTEFSRSSSASGIVLGGEAALTKGFPMLDVQAAGGLYDEITLEVFPEKLRNRILKQLPALTSQNLCRVLGQMEHLSGQDALAAGLNEVERDAVRKVDRMRNNEPRILRCTVDGDMVTFVKETALEPGGPRQHIYGAVRFLSGAYSSFQLVRGGTGRPDERMLKQMEAVVRSWRTGR